MVELGLPFCGLMSYEDEYFEWYNAITRRIITPLSQNVNADYEDHHDYYHRGGLPNTNLSKHVYLQHN
ncbi:hypothetical protein KSS87_002132 [Heliosperma pusillum]|nr:hypothetical protein KSS87_002132 [Heliosperma pusillum]